MHYMHLQARQVFKTAEGGIIDASEIVSGYVSRSIEKIKINMRLVLSWNMWKKCLVTLRGYWGVFL